MKVQLSAQDGISILTLEGAIDERTSAAIQAGVRKMFLEGKNRMLLDLSKATGVANDFVRQLCYLNILAREMSGEMALLAAAGEQKSKLDSFSSPKSISVFSALDEALKSFKAKEPVASAEPDLDQTLQNMELIKTKDEEIRKLREQLTEKEKGELGKIKQENTRLKELTKTLEKSVLEKLEFRRFPVEDPAVKQKLKSLEERVLKLASQMDSKDEKNAKPPAAAAPAAKK